MSVQAINVAVARIALDMIALARTILEDDSISTNVKIGKNTLKNSALSGALAAAMQTTDDPVINILFNNYVVYLEWTRPPKYGKQPPISVLKGWAEKNGIPTDASTLWAISYAIWRDGHQGRPIFATMDREMTGLYMNDWADKLLAAITDNLDKFFND